MYNNSYIDKHSELAFIFTIKKVNAACIVTAFFLAGFYCIWRTVFVCKLGCCDRHTVGKCF